jgi:hypothetical protein
MTSELANQAKWRNWGFVLVFAAILGLEQWLLHVMRAGTVVPYVVSGVLLAIWAGVALLGQT